jgi:hypothetical protein
MHKWNVLGATVYVTTRITAELIMDMLAVSQIISRSLNMRKVPKF